MVFSGFSTASLEQNMELNIPQTECATDLQALLNQVDTYVPGRTEGRTTAHTEKYTMHRYLETLVKNNMLTFPVSVEHSDKPDFVFKEKNTTIGIEVTEAVSKQFAAYCALREREFPKSILDLGLFYWGAPERTVSEMRELLEKNKITSSGWAGDSPEREWALYINSIVRVKLKKLAHIEFIKYHQNYLLIYDNLPLPNVHAKKATEYLVKQLQDTWSLLPSFDSIFVERGPVLVEITKNGSHNYVCEN